MELEKQLAELKTALEATVDAKTKTLLDNAVKAVQAQIDAAQKAANDAKAENDTLKTEVATLKTNAEKNQKWIDEQIEKGKTPPAPKGQIKSIKGALGEARVHPPAPAHHHPLLFHRLLPDGERRAQQARAVYPSVGNRVFLRGLCPHINPH